MITQLPEWHRIAGVDESNLPILENRSEVITELVKSKNLFWIFNCVKLYLNKPNVSKEFINELINSFLKSEPVFPLTKNHLLLRVLAGAIVYHSVENKKNMESTLIALSLQISLFGIKKENIINKDIIEYLIDYIFKEAIKVREENIELAILKIETDMNFTDNQNENLKLNFSLIEKQLKSINKRINNFNSSIKRLKEESNIHWWLFRGFSNDFKMPVSKLNINSSPLIIGKELADLTTFLPGPTSSKEFLVKILRDNLKLKDEEISFKESINNLDLKWREDLRDNYNDIELDNIPPPILTAISNSLDSGKSNGWYSIFEKSTSIKATSKFNVFDLAYQMNLECLFIKGIENYE